MLVAVQFWIIEWKLIISSAWNQKEYTWDKTISYIYNIYTV